VYICLHCNTTQPQAIFGITCFIIYTDSIEVADYLIPIRMSFCRKIFATFLRTQGVQQEIIDLLQGRIPRNVFVRHYYRPNFAEEGNRVSKLLPKLYQEIRP
jgi:intergrase/recombinase